jgi:hypothetical protein
MKTRKPTPPSPGEALQGIQQRISLAELRARNLAELIAGQPCACGWNYECEPLEKCDNVRHFAIFKALEAYREVMEAA